MYSAADEWEMSADKWEAEAHRIAGDIRERYGAIAYLHLYTGAHGNALDRARRCREMARAAEVAQ